MLAAERLLLVKADVQNSDFLKTHSERPVSAGDFNRSTQHIGQIVQLVF